MKLLAAALLVAVGAHAAAAQDSAAVHLKLSLADAAEVGRKAPAIILPYAIADSAGPASQPFNLSKELGNVVVLVFYPPRATASDDWRAIAAHLQSRLGNGVVVVGVASQPVANEVAFAHAIASPFKFVSDASGAVARRYGAANGRGTAGMTLVLVDREGVVRRVDSAFNPRAPQAFTALDASLAAALRR